MLLEFFFASLVIKASAVPLLYFPPRFTEITIQWIQKVPCSSLPLYYFSKGNIFSINVSFTFSSAFVTFFPIFWNESFCNEYLKKWMLTKHKAVTHRKWVLNEFSVDYKRGNLLGAKRFFSSDYGNIFFFIRMWRQKTAFMHYSTVFFAPVYLLAYLFDSFIYLLHHRSPPSHYDNTMGKEVPDISNHIC